MALTYLCEILMNQDPEGPPKEAPMPADPTPMPPSREDPQTEEPIAPPAMPEMPALDVPIEVPGNDLSEAGHPPG